MMPALAFYPWNTRVKSTMAQTAHVTRDKRHARAVYLLLARAAILAVTSITLGCEQLTALDVTLRLRLPDGAPATEGAVVISYGDSVRSAALNANGEAVVPDVPARYRASMARVKLDSDVYELVEPGKEYSLAVYPVLVAVRYTPVYGSGYRYGLALGRMRVALTDYHQVHGVYPPSLAELAQGSAKNEWGAVLGDRVTYRTESELGYVLTFAGHDGVLGTADDDVLTETSM
jgi:hypothetical protein